ncbi:mannose-1-phosphate guanyltransferase [Desulfolucanica intricata]|uniref:mannose-1-phosphate guanyltransferase n=1 Tax=Desulfolucanica intricata TaxID=1285191 RepID=UPI00082E9DF1|nr:mannose-1-phosphate guanyltransferase [Desulfolucanica intricata]
MKAIIMAGGEGSRLRPLTCGRPKPMVPVLNKPIMCHIIDLLKKHNLTDIGVTLQYQPDAIRDYFGNGAEFGVNMRYFVEEVPLGTAGSVKNAGNFLDETFLVISGDALTDLDLSKAIDFHRRRGSIATLVLTRVDCPLEYGVVITEENGRIRQFLEKPSWGEVFSDTVNTGIYILEPEVLDYFAPGQVFDFSKDLFPLLLKDKKPMFGAVLPGYWCDIGNLQQYLQSHYDALSGKVQVEIPGREITPGVWVGSGASINDNAEISGPVLIGDNCQIGSKVKIEPYSVIGEGCVLKEQTSVKRSVIWNHVFMGSGAAIRGAVLGSRVQVQANAGVYEGAVIGDDSVIKEHGLIKPDVKLWPNKLVDMGSVVQRSMIWGTRLPKKVFGLEGITGLANVEITPEFASRVGAAFGSFLGIGARAGVSCDNYPASQMVKDALISGLQSSGAEVFDLGVGITPMHRLVMRSMDCKGGVHIKISSQRPDKVTMIFTNKRGGNISRGEERKVENALMREDFQRVDVSKLRKPRVVPAMSETYLQSISRQIDSSLLRSTGFRLMLIYDRTNLERFIPPLFSELGLEVEYPEGQNSGDPIKGWQYYQDALPELAKSVIERKAHAGALLDPNADRLILVDGKGRVIKDELLTTLIALVILKEQGGSVVVPVTAPRVIETLAEQYQGRVVRTKTAIQDFLEKVMIQDESAKTSDDKESHISQFFMHFDALSALARIFEFCAKNSLTLAELVDEIPDFFLNKKEVPVPWEAKGRVIRELVENPPVDHLELLDGVKVYHPEGWALVLPDPEEPVCRVFSEGTSMEIAESLTDMYINKISSIVGAGTNQE